MPRFIFHRLLLAVSILLLVFPALTSRAEDLPRWKGYPAPRQGKVLLKIDPSGKVTGVSMLTSTGDRQLDSYAIHSFRSARFKAGTVPWVKIPVEFSQRGMTF